MDALEKIFNSMVDRDDYMVMPYVIKHVECEDGTVLSVQASEYHYCNPRDFYGPYSSVEIGFPSVPPPDSWLQYMDGDAEKLEDRTKQIYGYVPTNLVREFCNDHGGVKGFTDQERNI